MPTEARLSVTRFNGSPPLEFRSPERAPRQVFVELCGPGRAVSGPIALFPKRCTSNDGDVAVQGVDLVHRFWRICLLYREIGLGQVMTVQDSDEICPFVWSSD